MKEKRGAGMYISAEEIEDYIAQSPDPQLLRQVTQLVGTVFPEEDLRYFDNGRTFSALAVGSNPHPSPGYEEAGMLNISAQKNYVALYFYGSNVALQERFPKSAIGRGCLRIKNQKFFAKYAEDIRESLKILSDDKPHDMRD
ncbi:hypothetical protein RU85_GL000480 [Lactococcus garvieae]|nr:hypothetical protein RU85_GL000480 [Lactococcus garvieae]